MTLMIDEINLSSSASYPRGFKLRQNLFLKKLEKQKMHGVIFFQYNSFITKTLGNQKWNELLVLSGLERKLYMPTTVYPDSEIFTLVTNTAQLTSKSVGAILEEFGEFIVPSMLKVYAAAIKPEWDLFDILENTESTMHKAVRHADKKADPPMLICERISSTKVVIKYSSQRKMVELGVGIIKGLAKYKSENINISRWDIDGASYIEVTRKTGLG